MLRASLLALTVCLAPASEPEPDGARPFSKAQAFRTAPGCPAWLRGASHAAATVDCRHYQYEAYGSGDRYLARYIMFPEGQEAFLEIEQVLLFEGGPDRKPKVLKPAEIEFGPDSAQWKGRTWALLDRRDLLKP